jgi:hypothetical protein
MRLVATLLVFIVGGIGATAARWAGIHESGLVLAFVIIGAGMQSIAFILLYLFRSRPKAAPEPFGEPVRFERKE